MTKRRIFLVTFAFFFIISPATFAQDEDKKTPKEQTQEALKTQTEIFPALKEPPSDKYLKEKDKSEEKDKTKKEQSLKKKGKFKEETLMGDEFESGGYGALDIKFTKIAGKFAILAGGRGGWIVNHKFIIGAGGYGLVNNINFNAGNAQTYEIEMGYGGLLLEYIIHSEKIIHLGASIMTGAGQIGFKETDPFGSDHFFIFEPEVSLILNFSKYFRIATALSFRLTESGKLDQIENNDLIFLSGGIMFKFGKF